MFKRINIIFIVVMLPLLNVVSQEPIFSNFSPTMNFINPSLIAVSNNWSLKFIRRDQWMRIPSKLTTNGFSFETSVGQFGYAISYSQNIEGELSFKNQDFSSGFSLSLPIRKSTNIRFGVSGRLLTRSIDYSNITFFGNLDPILGNVNSINYSLSNSSNSFTELNPDISCGLGINYHKSNPVNRDLSFNSFKLGISVNNLLKQEKGLISSSINYVNFSNFPFPMKFTIYGFNEFLYSNNSVLNNPKSTYFSQSYFYQISGPLSTFQINLINIDNGPFDMGVGYRSQGISINEYIKRESIICNLGFQKINPTSSLTLGLSYDFTISQLNNISSGGTFEIMLIIESITGGIFDSYFSEAKLKKWRKKQVQCSRLGRPTYSKRLEGFSKKKKLFNSNMGKM